MHGGNMNESETAWDSSIAMNQLDAESLNVVAAHYVLGILSQTDRQLFQSLLQERPELLQLTYGWERRLNPMAYVLAPHSVPPQLWQKIERYLNQLQAIGTPDAVQPDTIQTSITQATTTQTNPKGFTFWQPWAWLSTALAAGLVLWIAVQPARLTVSPQTVPMVAQQSRDIAILTGEKQTASWVVRQQNDRLLLSAVGQQTVSADRDLELWVVAKNQPPRSLGVIHLQQGEAVISSHLTEQISSHMTLAISLEPKNGSPTGQPTGAVLYSGQVV